MAGPEYRYAPPQHGHARTAEGAGGLISPSLFPCSNWGSIAKHVMTHLQPTHVTTQAGHDIRTWQANQQRKSIASTDRTSPKLRMQQRRLTLRGDVL
jgi:hypothetical protein